MRTASIFVTGGTLPVQRSSQQHNIHPLSIYKRAALRRDPRKAFRFPGPASTALPLELAHVRVTRLSAGVRQPTPMVDRVVTDPRTTAGRPDGDGVVIPLLRTVADTPAARGGVRGRAPGRNSGTVAAVWVRLPNNALQSRLAPRPAFGFAEGGFTPLPVTPPAFAVPAAERGR